MGVMGLQSNDEQEVLSLVSAVLHLGNITFKEKGNYADVADKQCEYRVRSSSHFTNKIRGTIYVELIRLIGTGFK